MQVLKWVIAGLIGGAIGAAAWIAVGYFGNAEVGWIAWGIGVLVGLGVRKAAGNQSGWGPGVTAASIAVGMVVLAKYAVVSLLIGAQRAELGDYHVEDPAEVIAMLAYEVAEEYEQAGHAVDWPAEDPAEDAPPEASFPPDVWAEAKQRWERLSPEDQQKRTEEHEKQVTQLLDQVEEQVRGDAFAGSFGPWDLLWFALATVTAFKLGSGMASEK